jgi:uncharacterized protein (TIGR03086 family)
MALSEGPAERHREVAGAFTGRVLRTTSWDAPAPVAGWVARDVVRHLTTWFPEFLEHSGVPDLAQAAVPDADVDPVGAWVAHTAAVQSLLDDPASAARDVSDPHVGQLSLAQVVDRFYTADVFMHTWDLARATGQDERLDPDFCAQLLAGMEPMEQAMRSSGHYGPRVPVPPGSDAQTRLLGFIGRDPLSFTRSG